MTKKLKPLVHPGKILRETLLPEAGISVAEAAAAMGETEQTLSLILNEQMPLTAPLCLKIARFFDSSPEMWIRLQATYDLQQASMDEKMAETLAQIVPSMLARKGQHEQRGQGKGGPGKPLSLH